MNKTLMIWSSTWMFSALVWGAVCWTGMMMR